MKYLTSLFIALLFCTFSFAQTEVHPLDEELNECVNENYSNHGMIQCHAKYQEEWDKLLNKYYKLLTEHATEDIQLKLKESQRTWLKMRDQEFEFIESFYGSMEGSMYNLVIVNMKRKFVRNRALELKAYYNILEMDE